jgi:uncharacterized protein YigA (DUF484 family)
MNPMSPNAPITPITEDDIADFQVHTPDFFERHAELLATVQLTSPHGQRAVSLQERQAEMLRDKIRQLEWRLAEWVRNGQENVGIADKLHQWTLALMRTADLRQLPGTVADGLQRGFGVPQASLKVWGVAPAWAQEPFALGASADVQAFASSLAVPYCGGNPGLEAVQWLPEPGQAASLALIALRHAGQPQAFGLLVLASPDPQRFDSAMGTDFLVRIGELASAALSRLTPG